MVRADAGCDGPASARHWLRNVDAGVNGLYVTAMKEKQSLPIRFEMRADDAWLKRVDDWRRVQPSLPGRAEAIRRLVEKALSD